MTREQLRRQGEAMGDRLRGDGPDLPQGFGTLLTEAVFGGIWTRPGLTLADRVMCALAATSVVPAPRALRRLIGAALDAGLTAEAVREVLVQTGLYAGFTVAEETLTVAAEVFASRGVAFPPDPPVEASLEKLTERGRALMGRLHGDRAQLGYAAPDNPVTGALYPMAIQYRLWRDLVPSGAGAAPAGAGCRGGVHRIAVAGERGEIRPVSLECWRDTDRADRGGGADCTA